MDEPQAEQQVAPPAPTRRRGGVLVKLVLVLGVLAAAGGAGAWWWLRGTATAAAAVEEVAIEEQGLLSFEPFLVNLSDAGGNRFLKANIEIVLASKESAKHIEETPVMLMQLRSAILELLTQQTAPELVTGEGKASLKRDIKARAVAVLKNDKVLDVLFSEFVVQF
jgi:flagellar FliL protein